MGALRPRHAKDGQQGLVGPPMRFYWAANSWNSTRLLQPTLLMSSLLSSCSAAPTHATLPSPFWSFSSSLPSPSPRQPPQFSARRPPSPPPFSPPRPLRSLSPPSPSTSPHTARWGNQ